MGKRGPRKAPTVLKITRGTHRADRDGDPSLEPNAVPVVDCPPAPESLGEVGRAAWIDSLPKMIAAGYFTHLDLRAFERYCRAHDEVAKCDQILLEEGEYAVAGESGYIAQHPAVNQRFKWLDIMRRYEDAFWLNPTARSGKQIAKPGSAGVPKRQRTG